MTIFLATSLYRASHIDVKSPNPDPELEIILTVNISCKSFVGKKSSSKRSEPLGKQNQVRVRSLAVIDLECHAITRLPSMKYEVNINRCEDHHR